MYKSVMLSANLKKRNPDRVIKLPAIFTFLRPKYPDSIPHVKDPTKELAVKILAKK